jgi:hypothetical protein
MATQKEYLMKLQVSKNIQFTRLLKADGRLREFNFRKLGGLLKGMFGVDVVDDRGNRLIFKMQKEDSNWKIVEQDVPVWIADSSANLHEKIEEMMNSINPEENSIVTNE